MEKPDIDAFLGRLAESDLVIRLFAHLPNIVFCMKDRRRVYLAANQGFADRLGLVHPGKIVGRTADDLFPPELAENYRRQDEEVLASDTELTDRLELVNNPDGSLGWYLANKFPLHDRSGGVCGLVGISRDLRTPAESEYRDLARLVDAIHAGLEDELVPSIMAREHGFSLAQLDRRMRRVFHLTTAQFIRKARIDHAAQLLASTDLPLVEIALASGYGDQSAFTRQFKATVGVPPATYRRHHRK